MPSTDAGTSLTERPSARASVVIAAALVAAAMNALAAGSLAQGAAQPAPATTTGAGAQQGFNTTVVPRTGGDARTASADGTGQITLSALISADGQPVQQGIVWRIYADAGEGEAKAKLLHTIAEASPQLKLAPGSYYVNAAFGRANLTRKIAVAAGQAQAEQFILNAGGLKITALVDKDQPAPPNSIHYDVFSDERDQLGNRARLMTGARPGLIIRLNAGIYQIASTFGDANAIVRADVTVEAGKLTLATIKHSSARVTFKLVNRAGGEALADTQWVLYTKQGELVKESAGALPNHIIAPGSYTIVAKNAGRMFKRDFAVQAGDVAQVEVVVE